MNSWFDWKISLTVVLLVLGLIWLDQNYHLKQKKLEIEDNKNKVEIIVKQHEDTIKTITIKRDEEIKASESISDSAAVELFKQLVTE